ncbi:MAG TPA: N-methyl-L-tryptophan oxidase [Chitinophagaceae bacterium]|nr:N-methyl-L-tryptophan oxidase [Chitinophagaceae bacterium]
MIHFDHIVIGVGSMGSATCYHLAKRGRSVLGIEQFTIPHELGSHTGESRIIRKAYYEHPDYIPLLIRAYEHWDELTERSGKTLYHKTGLIYAAPKDHLLLQNIRNAAHAYNIPLQWNISSSFSLPESFHTLFEPDAGFVEPENTIRALVKHAIDSGAEIHEREQVLDWSIESNGDVVVRTTLSEYSCKKLVITSGAWSKKIIPGIGHRLRVTRQVLAWFKPAEPQLFDEHAFPCWMVATGQDDGVYYGFPINSSHPGALKLAYHWPGTETDPDLVDRMVVPGDVQQLEDFLQIYLPSGYGEIESTKVCLYSNSPDEHFVIDNLPGKEEKVCVAWGFSGHGFKFVPVVGEILADLAMYHKTDLPIGFLSAKRVF